MVTLGGIIGAQLTTNPALATLPASLWVVGTALTTIPAALLMRRIGRPAGFSLAALTACGALLFAYWALRQGSFTGFLIAATIFGVNMAFAQQYRFAAIESAPAQYAGRAVSLVLLASVGGAFASPVILSLTGATESFYERTMLTLAGLYLVCALAASFLKRTDLTQDATRAAPARSLRKIAGQPLFIVAVLGGATGYGVMVFVMTATPLSMHVVDGYSLEQTASVIRAHVLAMYLPSFFSGYLIDRLGAARMVGTGAVALLMALAAGMVGHTLPQYWTALILLGIGWNFMFVGSTTMLTYTYSREERFGAQAVNDFCIFGTTAVGSLLAGTIMYAFGWFTTVITPIPLLLIVVTATFLIRQDPNLRKALTG